MLDILNTLIIGRIVERIIIVIFAGISITLGWKLFAFPLNDVGEAEVKRKDFSFVIKRIAPGVFFALFGATVLLVSLIKSPSIDFADNPSIEKLLNMPALVNNQNSILTSTGQRHLKLFEYNGAADISGEKELLRLIRSLNTAIRVATLNGNDQRVLGPALDDLKGAAENLEKLRNNILVERLGEEDVNLWKNKGESFNKNPLNLNKNERDTLTTIAPWFEQGELYNE
ncbi:hypothetical protein PL263_04000 [Methylomonas sp. EFPC3]|uniref:hypothetical protein n=1 Tax=Methylomonas sp. EFPC3 TaxID=3021710 RepID=UPI002415EA0A|nr:hypothetical protein [Methylomonas sp. EFPC3]WFP51195.1 hypothetical protein PL263_04000 [Methylomonas sp. EFPC3]